MVLEADIEMERKIMEGNSPLAVYLLPFLPKVEFSYDRYDAEEAEGIDRKAVERLKARGVRRLTFDFGILEANTTCTRFLRVDPKLSEEEKEALKEDLELFAEEVNGLIFNLDSPDENVSHVGAITFDLFREKIVLAYKTYVWTEGREGREEWVPVRHSAVKVEVSLEKFLKLKEKVKAFQALSKC